MSECGTVTVVKVDAESEKFSYHMPSGRFGGVKTGNTFKVPKRQWSKWCEEARWTFNRTLLELRTIGWGLMKHPEAPDLGEKEFETVTWNSSWIAADVVNAMQREKRAAEKFFGAGASRRRAVVAVDDDVALGGTD